MKHFAALAILSLAVTGMAHDIWIEASPAQLKGAGTVQLQLFLGNHGNHHRDFQIASMVEDGDQDMKVIDALGKLIPLTGSLTKDTTKPLQGFWKTAFRSETPGIYEALSTFDKVMSYAPVRDVKSAKAYWNVSGAGPSSGFVKRIDGVPFELVPLGNPCALKRGDAFEVQVMFGGKPMPNVVVNFIPQGVEAKGEFDPMYQTRTNGDGVATMKLTSKARYLISAHWEDTSAKGEGYQSINYSATVCLSTL